MSSVSGDSVEDRLLAVSEQLQIPTTTLQITKVRLGQLRNKPDVDEENIDGFAAAALALSAREDGLPVSEDVIAEIWSETLDPERTISLSNGRLETTRRALDVDEVPPHPIALMERLGDAVEMPEGLVVVARRLLNDAFETDPTTVANGRSSAATVGGALALAALVNGHDADDVQDVLAGASKTSRIALENRREELQRSIGQERLASEQYQMAAETDGAVGEGREQATAADGAGKPTSETTAETQTAEADEATAQTHSDDEEPAAENEAAGSETTDNEVVEEPEIESGTDASDVAREADASDGAGETDASDGADEIDAGDVEAEIDALVEELDIDASTRLMARGMVSDAVGEVDIASAAELAGATVVAGLRMQDGAVDVVDVAGLRAFEPRDITQSLDALDTAVDIDIPRRGPDDIVEELVRELGLSESVQGEARQALERYAADDDRVESDYTAAELGAGAVVFAATVDGTQVDLDDLSAISGAGANFITDAMNRIVVSLCRSLVRGDIDYETCSWTTDLLESKLSSNLGDSETGRTIAIAKTYIAGREGRHIGDAELAAVMGE